MAEKEKKEKKGGAPQEKPQEKKEKREKKPRKGAETPVQVEAPKVSAKRPSAAGPPPRLWTRYKAQVVPQLMRDLGDTNPLAVPRMEKIVINMGVGKAAENEKRLPEAVQTLAAIAGQKPLVTRAKISVAQFRIRQGSPVGCMVTLRKARMYEFLDRLISLAIPRIRDFRGLSLKSFDRSGNYSFGVSEQVIFPEMRADRLEFSQGMDITLCTTGGTPQRSLALLRALGMPFRKEGEKDDEQKKARGMDPDKVKAVKKKGKQEPATTR